MALHLSTLHRIRGSVKASLTRLERTLHNPDTVFSVDNISSYEELLKECQKKFDEVQRNIYHHPEVETDEDFEKESLEQADFEDRVVIVQTKIKHIYRVVLKTDKSASNDTSTAQSTQEQSQLCQEQFKLTQKMVEALDNFKPSIQQVKLPPIDIPKFSGKYNEWTSFRDMFSSSIHNNQNLPEVEKCKYLMAYLIGEAKSLVSHLSITEQNYKIAWDIIKDRFEKKQNIVTSHIQTFFNQPAIAGEASAKSLRRMLSTSQEVINALDVLGCEQRDIWLVHILVGKMDKESRTLWSQEISASEIPTLKRFFDFLEKRYDSLEMVENQESDQGTRKANDKPLGKTIDKSTKNTGKKSSLAVTEVKKCSVCSQEAHKLFQCTKFVNSTPAQKLEILRKANICTNCIRGTHSVETCTSSSCRRCNLRHNTLLHEAFVPNTAATDHGGSSASPTPSAPAGSPASATEAPSAPGTGVNLPQTSAVAQSAAVSTSLFSHPAVTYHSVLPTVSLYLIDNQGKRHKCRALLDSCSQPNFITRRLVEKSGIPTYIKSDKTIAGIGVQTTEITHAILATINSTDHTFATRNEFLVMDKITDNQPIMSLTGQLNIPENILLADPEFSKPQKIDMLLGVDIFVKAIRPGKIVGNPTLFETAFGYVVAGHCKTHTGIPESSCLCVTQKSSDSLTELVEKFWKLEEPGGMDTPLKEEEVACEDHFTKHVTRDQTGRYIVRLPTRENLNQLGESRDMAMRRFLCMERRLQKDANIREQYLDFLRQYEELGHMRKLPQDYKSVKPEVYLPHHPVVKLSSSTTPVRVVFDASAKTTTGVSLNDVLMVGPQIQDNILHILLRFRQHSVAIKADIRKMFRQVRVAEDDQNLLRILHRDSPQNPIQTYLLSTVTYGTSSASFLSTRCIQQLAHDEGDSFPLAKQAALRDFYVDDFLSGESTITAAQELQQQMRNLMARGGFHLTKWMSSNAAALTDIPQDDCEMNLHDNLGADENTTTALGMVWNTSPDLFTYRSSSHTDRVTKRSILSESSKTFDPLGFVTPVVIRAKILVRTIWIKEADWDDDLTDDTEISNTWYDYQQSLNDVNLIKVPRRMTVLQSPVEHHLLVFCDASQKAYAACIYIKTIDKDGNTDCNLLFAKSKVAPRKTQTLPRLELLGAVLGMQVLTTVEKSLTIKIDSVRAYTDSTIVLHWLAREPQRWQTFVANRVAEIQKKLPRKFWHHIPSQHNPADVASRGTTPKDLAENLLWWKGPHPEVLEQLQDKNLETPIDPTDKLLEQRTTCAVSLGQHSTSSRNSETVATDQDFWVILQRFSSYNQMLRHIAIWRRYLHNLKAKVNKTPLDFSLLSVREVMDTESHIIRHIQQDYFPDEFRALQSGDQIPKKSRLKCLTPFLDDSNLMRVGGRLQASNLDMEQKHPMLLPAKHHVSRLIADKIHTDTCHGGPQMILATMRQKFWPLRGLDEAKAAIKRCLNCFRNNPKAAHQLMGNLPPARVLDGRPFQRVGVDYCGPFHIRLPTRGGRSVKMYVSVFICFISRAIHLELVSELSTEAYLAAFKRFVARRGKPTDVFSDNATNLVGAASQLREIQEFLAERTNQEAIIKHATDENITFHFIPPRSPHFGGLWEAAVKAFKKHFYRVVGNEKLTQEVFLTVLAEIEMCLNSRPLTPLSNDPSDMEVLTPWHFLHGVSPNAVPAHDVSEVPKNRLNVWRRIDQMKQHFWQRWSKEILQNMQQRGKWQTSQPNINIGDLVLLIEDNLPPLAWIHGRVTELHPGRDGITRVVTVRTASGIYKRAITRVAPFPKEITDPEVDTSATGKMSQLAACSANFASAVNI